MTMKVSLDGGVTYQEVPQQNVRVLIEDLDIPGEDERGELLINITDEGVIQDVWVNVIDAVHNIGTSSETFDEIVERLVEEGA